MQKSIVIDISAPVHSGKTVLASAIAKLLSDAGFSNITTPDLEEYPEKFKEMSDVIHTLKEHDRGNVILGLPVIITQTNLRVRSRTADNTEYVPTQSQLLALLDKARSELLLGIGDVNEGLIGEINEALGGKEVGRELLNLTGAPAVS